MTKQTTIQFYHLRSTSRERAVPKLMEKALASGARVVVMAASDSALKAMSEALWTNDADSFLPHGTVREPHAAEQPIILTVADENPNNADILCVLDGVSPASLPTYSKVLDVFDGSDDSAVAAARQRWTRYKDEGHKLQYVKQQQGGGWKIEAEAG
jgi:DNA polymerase-3 subunit chi